MYARVASFEGGDIDRLQAVSEERMSARTMGLPAGVSDAMVLHDRGSGRRLFVTPFDSRESLDAAESQFDSMGKEIPEEIRGRRTGMDVFEVVWRHAG